MKKKYLAFFIAATLMFSSVSVFGETSSAAANDTSSVTEQDQSLWNEYTDYITVDKDSSLATLTLEDATKKAINNSSSIKNTSASIDLTDTTLESSYDSAMAGDDNGGFSSLISFINSKTNYENSITNLDAEKASLKHSVKSSYISLIETQRDIELLKMNLKIEDNNLTIAKAKYSLGKLSKSDLETEEKTYNDDKTTLANKQDALEKNYKALNILIGASVDTRYNFELDPVYKPFEISMPVDSYINGKVALSNSVAQAKKTYESKKQTSSLSSISNSEIGGYQSAQNSLNSAKMSYDDKKDDVYQSLLSKYNDCMENEKSYKSNVEQLKLLKNTLERTQANYQNGKATELDLLKAKYNVANLENTMISEIYSHMLLVEELTDTNLM
ncbi:MAG: TolC family protein [Clostridia bacterium]|jgi:outer membrane protein TolC|nr:TolC family protein [Clostridia bacterium]